jgi:hypothetical protein
MLPSEVGLTASYDVTINSTVLKPGEVVVLTRISSRFLALEIRNGTEK